MIPAGLGVLPLLGRKPRASGDDPPYMLKWGIWPT